MKEINVTKTLTAITNNLASTLMLHELRSVWSALDIKGVAGAIALYERKVAHWTVEDGRKVLEEYRTTLGYLNLVDNLFVRLSMKCAISIVEMTKALAMGLRFIWRQLSVAVVTVTTVVKQGLKALFNIIRKGLHGGNTMLKRVFRNKNMDDDDDIIIQVEEEEGNNTPTSTPSIRIVKIYQPVDNNDIVHNLMVGSTGRGQYTTSKEMQITAITTLEEDTDEVILNKVFAMSNNGEITAHHSISCGDVVQVGTVFYRCLPVGWDKLN